MSIIFLTSQVFAPSVEELQFLVARLIILAVCGIGAILLVDFVWPDDKASKRNKKGPW
jgi:hypothetical protein